jgi:hypothetical protein
MDSAQRRLAERRLLAALRRLHRREPMRPTIRTDALIRELRADPGERLPAGHRGGGSLRDATDGALIMVLDGLVVTGKLLRDGHRLRLPDHAPTLLDPEMHARVERLMAGLRDAGAQPPRVEGIAARLGIPPGVVAQLRGSGALVSMGEGIDYPREVAVELRAGLDEMARRGPLTVSRVREALGTSRRHAEALLAYRGQTRTRQGRCPISRR